MRTITVLVLLVVGLLLISLSVKGQSVVEVYGPKVPAERRAEVTSFQYWLKYFDGTNWGDQQKAYLERAARDPLAIKYEEFVALGLFTPDQVRDVFYKVGGVDISVLKRMYHTDVLSSKAGLLRSMPLAEKGAMWKGWMAYEAMTHPDLTRQQIDHMYRFTHYFDHPSTNERDALRDEAVAVLGLDLAKEIYGPIGPYSSLGDVCRTGGGPSTVKRASAMQADCSCSFGSWFNWGCSGTCVDSMGQCRHTEDGCGFGGLYMCDGGCKSNDESSKVLHRRRRTRPRAAA